jgi:hypothetical protein
VRAVLTLFLVFGALIVTYAVHWARRASVATADASAIFKETGSITATAKRLYAEQSLPDNVRLSHKQREYVDANNGEFQRIYGPAVDDQVARGWQSYLTNRGARSPAPTEAETAQAMEAIISVTVLRHAKMFCESRGIA